MKVFVGIPAYDRKISAETARSLLTEQGVATAAGVEVDICIAPGSSLITHARDFLAREFMNSEADKMVFVDADVGWEPGALVKLAAFDRDFIGGAYRHKADKESYPVRWLDRPELWSEKDGALEVETVPGGFLAVTKAVFERLQEHTKRAMYQHGPDPFYPFFHCPPGAGEDYTFCLEWRAAGGQVFVDPTLTLHHVDGAQKYSGCIGEWLKNRDGA